MRRVFADTLYWLALFVPDDEWAEAAGVADLSDASLVTTEEVLSEFLTAYVLAAITSDVSPAGQCAKFSTIQASRWFPSRTNLFSVAWRCMKGGRTNNTASWIAFP